MKEKARSFMNNEESIGFVDNTDLTCEYSMILVKVCCSDMRIGCLVVMRRSYRWEI